MQLMQQWLSKLSYGFGSPRNKHISYLAIYMQVLQQTFPVNDGDLVHSALCIKLLLLSVVVHTFDNDAVAAVSGPGSMQQQREVCQAGFEVLLCSLVNTGSTWSNVPHILLALTVTACCRQSPERLQLPFGLRLTCGTSATTPSLQQVCCVHCPLLQYVMG